MGYTTNYNFASNTHEYKKVLDSYASNSYSNYDRICNSIISQSDINQSYDVSDACRRVMGYLSHIAQNGSSKDSVNKCKYLYYWLYYDLLAYRTHHSYPLKLYKKLLELYKQFDNYPHLCNNYVKEIENIKLVNAYKLIQLYSTFRNDPSTSSKCYCVCAKKCYELYKMFAGDCHNTKDEDLCYELENFKYIYDRNMLSFTPIASSLKRRKLRKKINYGNEYMEQHEHSHIPSTSNMASTIPYYLLSYSYNQDT
ncbi:hypothetical protein PVMG_05309 [Plasmodium vivax Mauritania I]|uniref:Uncharacterized protein n=1 Tax=Plasmodium vivax Mauritania I TaxID=1035515 RepID=A0A0J9TKB7_PLAVI|nr:hypothetical protein PVMG_05309 [Plasmodium vivax Mauritania I]